MDDAGNEDQEDPEWWRSVPGTTPDSPTPALTAPTPALTAPTPALAAPTPALAAPTPALAAPTAPLTAQQPPRRRALTALALAAVVLVIAGLVYVVTRPPRHSANGPSRTSASSTPNDPTSTTLTTYDPAKVAALVDPAIVDVNTTAQETNGYAYTAGTGMIVTSDGFIVTNNHVVESATRITVTIAHHAKRLRATFVGADPADDVAVIKVQDLSDLPTVKFGNSADASLGEPVVAIGNALGKGGTPATTSGTILALNRSIAAADELQQSAEQLSGMIEASSAIQPGNSGGPLLDDQAQVIGMNTADDGGRSTAFAIPIDRVAEIVSLIEHGRSGPGVVMGLQAFLGMAVQDVPAQGVLVTRIIDGDPAAKAGVEPGDVIVAFNGQNVANAADLRTLVTAQRVGAVATLAYTSSAGTRTQRLTLAAGPAP
jgi:S1-C subfamily serine protease